MKTIILCFVLVSCASKSDRFHEGFAHGLRAGCIDAMHSISTKHLDDNATLALANAERANRVCHRKMQGYLRASGK